MHSPEYSYKSFQVHRWLPPAKNAEVHRFGACETNSGQNIIVPPIIKTLVHASIHYQSVKVADIVSKAQFSLKYFVIFCAGKNIPTQSTSARDRWEFMQKITMHYKATNSRGIDKKASKNIPCDIKIMLAGFQLSPFSKFVSGNKLWKLPTAVYSTPLININAFLLSAFNQNKAIHIKMQQKERKECENGEELQRNRSVRAFCTAAGVATALTMWPTFEVTGTAS